MVTHIDISYECDRFKIRLVFVTMSPFSSSESFISAVDNFSPDGVQYTSCW